MGKHLDLTGKRFGRLVVIRHNGYNKFKQKVWLCECDCGNFHEVSTNLLNRGVQSCGCLALEVRTKHGKYKDKIYQIWHNMKSRCSESNEYYGKRGISFYPAWDNFEIFYNDFGYTFPGGKMTIERIDVNGNYEPGNVIWATMKVQNLNKRNTKLNETKILQIRQLANQGVSYSEISRIMSISYSHARSVAIGERC